jgi:hypothetical protein
MRRRHQRWRFSLRRRSTTRWSNMQAAILSGAAIAATAWMIIAGFVRHTRFLEEEQSGWPFNVPWDSSWPSLPVVSPGEALAVDVAQPVYALAATNAATLQYVSCYCGCRSEGHHSVFHCYVKRHSADGRVIEWEGHGRICPLGADITGDATSWRQRGMPLSEIRTKIDREFSPRGPATATPPETKQ